VGGQAFIEGTQATHGRLVREVVTTHGRQAREASSGDGGE
jgi:hypothetical protein